MNHRRIAEGEFAKNMVVCYVQQQGASYIGQLVADGKLTEAAHCMLLYMPLLPVRERQPATKVAPVVQQALAAFKTLA